jgi:hypothetical protein
LTPGSDFAIFVDEASKLIIIFIIYLLGFIIAEGACAWSRVVASAAAANTTAATTASTAATTRVG